MWISYKWKLQKLMKYMSIFLSIPALDLSLVYHKLYAPRINDRSQNLSSALIKWCFPQALNSIHMQITVMKIVIMTGSLVSIFNYFKFIYFSHQTTNQLRSYLYPHCQWWQWCVLVCVLYKQIWLQSSKRNSLTYSSIYSLSHYQQIGILFDLVNGCDIPVLVRIEPICLLDNEVELRRLWSKSKTSFELDLQYSNSSNSRLLSSGKASRLISH